VDPTALRTLHDPTNVEQQVVKTYTTQTVVYHIASRTGSVPTKLLTLTLTVAIWVQLYSILCQTGLSRRL